VLDDPTVEGLLAQVEDRDDSVSAIAAAALHGLLDAPGEPPVEGAPLPALWHWLAFLPNASQGELGADGHPTAGPFMPANRPPRRMFAGGRLSLVGQAAVGGRLHRHSRATSVSEKVGRTGTLLFVEVTHEISAGAGALVVDVQDIVYRDAETKSGQRVAGPADAAASEEWEWRLALDPSATLLFRFSALTYNAHRIHYDLAYATQVEGYPNLVVHGPLQAIALAELCRRNAPDRRVTSFDFRARRPAFCGAALTFRGRWSGADTVELEALTGDHDVTMTATATLAP
jgi:3-methylfumaryl-CoA hydratase